MKQNYMMEVEKFDIVIGHDVKGTQLREIVTEANHEPDGRLRSPEVLVLDNLTGVGRMLLNLSDASRYCGYAPNSLSVKFSVAKKKANGKLVQTIQVKSRKGGNFTVTRMDWVTRNLMIDVKNKGTSFDKFGGYMR